MDLEKALTKVAGKIGVLEVNLTLRELELEDVKELISNLEREGLGRESVLLSTQNALLAERAQSENYRVRLLEFEKPKPRAKPRNLRKPRA